MKESLSSGFVGDILTNSPEMLFVSQYIQMAEKSPEETLEGAETLPNIFLKSRQKPRALLCNLFGGPGTGKSTNAALLFGKLKIAGVNVELVTEYAKDLTWEGRNAALAFQPYVTAKQMWRIARLANEVDVIITDSPFILGLSYPTFGCTPSFERFVVEAHDLFHNYSVYLTRGSGEYSTSGRSQSEDEARALDAGIISVLVKHEIPHENVFSHQGEETAEHLKNRVLQKLSDLRA